MTIVLYLMVKKYTVYFDIIGVVGPRRLKMNFLELSLQEEFHVFNLYWAWGSSKSHGKG